MDIKTVKSIAFDVIADECLFALESEGSKDYFLACADGVRMLALKLINNIKEEKETD